MSLNTHSKFYYGYEVSPEAYNFDFQESGGPLVAVLTIAKYSLTDFCAELARAFNEAGSLTYTVTVNRATRFITISATGSFKLLLTTGANLGTTIAGAAGFSGSDTGSASSHVGNDVAGSSYVTQFVLQSYVAVEDFQSATYGTVNKSASGLVEVVSFGTENFMQCEFKYVNNFDNGSGAPIRYNQTGITDLRNLMVYLVGKGPVEFMPNEDDAEDYVALMLESTQDDQKGLKFKLREHYSEGLPGYFASGVLTFRALE